MGSVAAASFAGTSRAGGWKRVTGVLGETTRRWKVSRAARARALAAALAVAVLVGPAACGGGGEGGGDGDTEAGEDATSADAGSDATGADDPAGTTTTEALTPEEEVVRDYEAAFAAFAAAANPPDPEHPDFLARFTGDTLDRLQGTLRQYAGINAGADTSTELHPSDVVVVGDSATLVDCMVDHTQMVDLASGEPVGEAGETVQHLDVQLERADGVWKIALLTERTDPCTPG